MKATVEIEIQDQQVADQIINAVEGGMMKSWTRVMEYEWDVEEAKDVRMVLVAEAEQAMEDLGLGAPDIHDQFFGANFWQELDEVYENKREWLTGRLHTVTVESLGKVLVDALAGKYGRNGTLYGGQVVNEDDDAITADVLVQLQVFGEVRYG